MKYLNPIGGVILMILTLLALSQGGQSDAQSPTTIALSDVQAIAGQSAVIEAQITCSVGWCGDVALTVQFDPTFIQVDSVEVGPYFGEQYLDITSIDNEQGMVSFRATGIQADSATLDNVLFRLNVTPVDLGETMIELTDIEVKDTDENLIEASSISGRIEIDVDVENLLAILANYDWQIAFVSDRDGNPEIYVMNADGSNPTRLTENDGVDDMPAWSPDGAKIAFVSDREGNRDLFIMDADGSDVQRLTENAALDEMPAWSPSGTQIAFISDRNGDRNLYLLDVESGAVSPIVAPVEGLELSNLWSYPRWSPDGTQIALTSAMGEDAKLRIVELETAMDSPLFDEFVTIDHLAWSRDTNWLLYGTNSAENGDISILFIEREASEVLTTSDTHDYSPDLFDPQFCTVRTDETNIRLRVGPGFDRGIFGSFPAGQDIRVIGQATANDGSLWWQIDKIQIEGGATANSLWVAQDAVTASRRCARVNTTDAPPIINGGQSNTSSGQWGFCGSCNDCGPHPSSECVTSPRGVCMWDPTTCRNVSVVVTPPPNGPVPTLPPGADPCFSVSLNFRSTNGAAVSPAPSQSVNTASNCSTGPGFTAGTSVSIATQGSFCSTSCGPSGGPGWAFDHWEGTCGVGGGNNTSFTINNNCLATAVYRPVTIIG